MTINKPASARRIRERKIDPDQGAYRCPRKRRGLGICIQKQFDKLGRGSDPSSTPIQKRINGWSAICSKLKQWRGALADAGVELVAMRLRRQHSAAMMRANADHVK